MKEVRYEPIEATLVDRVETSQGEWVLYFVPKSAPALSKSVSVQVRRAGPWMRRVTSRRNVDVGQ